MTLGEYRVGIIFNPGNNRKVNEIKRMAAVLIDMCHEGTIETSDPEVGRLWSFAMTYFEDAAMWAVKAATRAEGVAC
jgi:hypothetical protein